MKKSIIAVLAAVLIAGCGFGGWKYYENKKVGEMREAAVAELRASVKPEEYREAEQQQISEIIEKAEAGILTSNEEGEADALIKDAAAEFAELKTDAQYTKEEEEEAKRQAEIERKKQEEEAARIAAEEEAARQAAEAAAAAQRKSSNKSSGGSGGCVGGGADKFY